MQFLFMFFTKMSPKKRCGVFLITGLIVLFLPALQSFAENLSWKTHVEKLQKRLERGSIGSDVSISFENSPAHRFMEDELVAYTVRGDGTVIIQMRDEVTKISVSPNEIRALAEFLLENGLQDFPENESHVAGSPAFSVIIRVGASRKGMWLYSRNNDIHREVVWQYLLHLGQSMLEQAGLRDKQQPILPVCRGIIKEDELDPNNDGVIEWLKLRIGWYNFKAGEYIIDFAGFRQTVFLAQGSSEREFFVNTFLLNPSRTDLGGLLKVTVDSKPAYPTGPYTMDIGLNPTKYFKKSYRTEPDAIFKGSGVWDFKLKIHQPVAIDIRSGAGGLRKVARFYLSEIRPDGIDLAGDGGSFLLAKDEKSSLGDFGCLSCIVRLKAVEEEAALCEVGWNIPEHDAVQRKIDYFKESLASDNFHGDKESVRSSLDFCEECLQDLETVEDLKILVMYCNPA